MVAVAELPKTAGRFCPAPESVVPTGATASALASGYLRYVSALWRSDRASRVFGAWLAPYWCASLPPTPSAAPAAVSPHGAGGRGICWYETPDAVLGYVPGKHGGYRVPAGAVASMPRLPSLRGADLAGRLGPPRRAGG